MFDRRRMGVAFSVMAVTFGLLGASPAAADDDLPPSITVVGEGEVQVKPDAAEISIGVTTEGAVASEAVKENSQRMAQLLRTLKELNVADKHVQTSNFNVSPKYTHDERGRKPPVIAGYTVSNQVNVKVVELDRLGAILDAVVQAGSNRINGISFSTAEPKPHLDQARRKAVADAKARAELYAAEAGVKLGKPLYIREQSAAVPRPMYAGVAMRGAMAAEVPIASGEQTISAQVTVTYHIE